MAFLAGGQAQEVKQRDVNNGEQAPQLDEDGDPITVVDTEEDEY